MENVVEVNSLQLYLYSLTVKLLAEPSLLPVMVPQSFNVPELNMSIGTGTPMFEFVLVLNDGWSKTVHGHPFQPQLFAAI